MVQSHCTAKSYKNKQVSRLPPNEIVEKPIAKKTSTKNSHQGLKNVIKSRQNAAKNTKT
jgi:hypothetical protein